MVPLMAGKMEKKDATTHSRSVHETTGDRQEDVSQKNSTQLSGEGPGAKKQKTACRKGNLKLGQDGFAAWSYGNGRLSGVAQRQTA